MYACAKSDLVNFSLSPHRFRFCVSPLLECFFFSSITFFFHFVWISSWCCCCCCLLDCVSLFLPRCFCFDSCVQRISGLLRDLPLTLSALSLCVYHPQFILWSGVFCFGFSLSYFSYYIVNDKKISFRNGSLYFRYKWKITQMHKPKNWYL